MAGSGGELVPTVNCELLEISWLTVTEVWAVSVVVFSLLLPIVVAGNSVGGPVSSTVTGAPKAITLPSRLPT